MPDSNFDSMERPQIMKATLIALTLTGLMLSSLAASAVDLPDMKPGLWQTTLQHSSGSSAMSKAGTTSHCLDAEAMAAAKQTGLDYAKNNCSRNETRRDGNKWVTDMICKLGKSTMTTHSVTAFSGDEAYHTEMTTTFAPPSAGQSQSGTIVDGKWLGACKGN